MWPMAKSKLPVRLTGQHFTIDKVLIADLIKQATIHKGDTVLDIGAGKGFLTVHLVKMCDQVIAIEKDKTLVKYLRLRFSNAHHVKIVGSDFRNYRMPSKPFKVVSNIPYGITSEILKILMYEHAENFVGGSIILQLEAAQKLVSNRLYNPFAVFYHTFFELRLLYKVSAKSFMPPPTVTSALLCIKRKNVRNCDLKHKQKYLAFVSCLLSNPNVSTRVAFKKIFRKRQLRVLAERFKIDLNAPITCLSPCQWNNCFLEMLDMVPEKFHPV